MDQTIEETVNRDTQKAGGTKGFSLKWAGVERYYLTSEYHSMYLKQLRRMVGRGMSHLSHPDLLISRITKDEADAQSIKKLLEDDWTNPSDQNETEFVSISTGILSPPDAHKIGTEAYEAFRRDRLEDETPKTQFHDKLTKKRLKTFSDIRKKEAVDKNPNKVILQADRKLFAQRSWWQRAAISR